MVKIIGMTFVITVLCVGLSISQSMKVHTKSSVRTFSLTDIDSITFEMNDVLLPAIFKLANNEIAQWVEDNEGYWQFNTAEQLYSAINGGADEYLNGGMIAGSRQSMIKNGTAFTADCMVMDFGTAAQATTIYQAKAEQISPKTAAGSYNESVAVIDGSFLSGCAGYAHFGQYYIEVSVSGYANKSEAVAAAAAFLGVFDAKIE